MLEKLYALYRKCDCRVTTDSRSIAGGEIFFALKGENFDGNAYALKALESGAAYAVVDASAGLPDDERLIKVDDSFKCLQQLAIYHRNHCAADGGRLPVIGLTGTNGKTTTKELIRTVLASKYRVVATEGNLNNDIGVPLSLLKIRPDTQIAVIEMGANHPDDIEKLVKVSQPDFGLITNVGKAHLLGFGSFDGVKMAKGALYRWLSEHNSQMAFLNADDGNLSEMAQRFLSVPVCRYGLKEEGVELLPTSAGNPYLRLKLASGRVVSTNLVGAYNAANVLAAIAVGRYFGVDEEAAVSAIESYVPANNRSQMLKTGSNSLIVDAYNANPSSMAAALDNFELAQADEKLALLGDMRELGADSLKEHLAVVNRLCAMECRSMLVGEEFGKVIEAAGVSIDAKASRGICAWFKDSDSLAEYLNENPVSNALVLVKGSRGIRMEKAIPAL